MSKVIFITGAASGFGRLTAEHLARQGHRLAAGMRDPAGRNRAAAEALSAQGILPLAADVTDDAAIAAAIAAVIARFGRIDVVINNAGIASAGITEAFSADQAKLVFNTNVVGVMRVTNAALPQLRAQGEGLVITIGSILGRITFPFFGLYGASKFALEALTDSYRYETAGLGVEHVLIQPSAYPTSMYASALAPGGAVDLAGYGPAASIPQQMFAAFGEMFGAAGAPDPQDVARAIAGVIAAPRGQRPARVLAGAPFGADRVNEASIAPQAAALASLGLQALDQAQPNA